MLLTLTLATVMSFMKPSDASLGLELSFAASPSQDRKELMIDITLRWVSDDRKWKLKNNEEVWIVVSDGKTGRTYTKQISLKGGFLYGDANEVKNRITVPAPSGSPFLVRVEFAYLGVTRVIVLKD